MHNRETNHYIRYKELQTLHKFNPLWRYSRQLYDQTFSFVIECSLLKTKKYKTKPDLVITMQTQTHTQSQYKNREFVINKI